MIQSLLGDPKPQFYSAVPQGDAISRGCAGVAQTGFHIRQARKAGAGGVGQLQRLAVWVSPPLLQCVMHLMFFFFKNRPGRVRWAAVMSVVLVIAHTNITNSLKVDFFFK